MSSKKRKIFVLDTNVILHDSSCIHQFQDNDVVIPITVLEELDQFKKGNDSLNYHAREFTRALDALSEHRIFHDGVRIAPGLGRIIIKLEQEFHEDLEMNFGTTKPDHRILNAAYHLFKAHPTRQVILVTKDVNLRMKAKAVGLLSEDYRSDHVKDISSLYKGRTQMDDIPDEILEKLLKVPFEIELKDLPKKYPFNSNEYVILKNSNKSVLAYYDGVTKKIKKIDKITAYNITPRNSEQSFALDALLNPNFQLVSIAGKAGTGKTLLALAAALERMKNYRQIFIARPIVSLSNKDIGFLPGDIQSKLDPYMQPLYDNLGVIQNQFPDSDAKSRRIKDLQDQEKLVIAPLSYIRGRSLVKIYFIVDEAQNLTPHEIKTIITRAGEGTKLVFTGDIFQIDHPYLDSHSNGLSYLIEKMQGHHLYAHVTLEKGERSDLAELASNLL